AQAGSDFRFGGAPGIGACALRAPGARQHCSTRGFGKCSRTGTSPAWAVLMASPLRSPARMPCLCPSGGSAPGGITACNGWLSFLHWAEGSRMSPHLKFSVANRNAGAQWRNVGAPRGRFVNGPWSGRLERLAPLHEDLRGDEEHDLALLVAGLDVGGDDAALGPRLEVDLLGEAAAIFQRVADIDRLGPAQAAEPRRGAVGCELHALCPRLRVALEPRGDVAAHRMRR